SRYDGADWSAFYGSNNTSENDTLILGENTRGYYGSGWKIKGSVIKSPNSNSGYEAIYCTGGTLEVSDVTIENCHRGIYGSGAGGSIKHSLVKVYGSDYGLKFESNSNMTLYQNTIIGKGVGSGIVTTSNATLKTNSNLIHDFTTGISADSPNYTQTSLLYNNINHFAGLSLSAQVGQVVTVNGNATPSDIYGNIFLNPMFFYPDTGNYHLLSNSPAINAGDIDSLDVDGTIADIGAYPYNFGFVPQNLAVRSTGDGWIEIGWTISATDSLTGCKGYYKQSTGSTWTSAGQTGENYLRFTGLTNNVSYDFAVAAVYPSKESIKSRKISEKPGLVNYQINPRYLTVFQQTSQTTIKNIAFINNGTKDLTFTLTGVVNAGTLSASNGVVAPYATVNIADTLKGTSTGIKIGKIKVVTNNYPNPLDSICILQVVGTYTALNPVKFTPPSSVENKFYIVLETGSIDGEPLQTGDEVGIFDGEVCVGAGGFNGSFPMIITCYGADGGSPGFTEGDSLIIKLYDASKARYATVNVVNYSFGNGHFVDGGFAKASLQGSVYQTVNIPLTANRFNLISIYLYPKYPNISSIFGNLTDLKIVYEDNGSSYIPQYGINTIGDMDITEGYHVFVAGEDKELSLQGMTITPQNWQITLNKNQFNSISYLYDAPMSVEYAFADIASQIEIVQDDAGGVWIPSMSINSLVNLQPLSGYQVFTNAQTALSFTYPVSQEGVLAKRILASGIEPALPLHFQYTETGLPYTVVITTALMDNHSFENGDEVGIFYNELCVGATVWNSEKVNFVTAWKGSEEFNVPGFRSEAPITFKAFSKRFNSEFGIDATFRNESQKYFEGAAYSIVSLKGAPGLIPDKYALRPSYPNPFNASTHIVYDVPDNAKVSIMIYNILGKEVIRLADNEFHIPGKYNIIWNGTDKFGKPLSSGIYLIRMTAPEFYSVHKVILMK
ncbi:MAG: T9SS type A sorting domain-containing protein, partial [Candidatus Marinimicrobia bacterium]|nr:T9SS type A sorting domain-containing protein [Candidatus Neomarinimicrobiota bacterium]